MTRSFAAGLMASVSTPWALREETLRSIETTLLMYGGPGPGALPVREGWVRDLTEPVGAAALADPEAAEPEAAIHPATERAAARKSGAVAVIPIKGVISPRVSLFDLIFGGGATPPAWIVQQVRNAMADDQVKAVILDIDSPGGNVIGVHEAASALLDMRGTKPFAAQVSGVCASAAYWIGSAADEMIATPTAVVGSIGVYQTHQDFSKLYEEIGVKVTNVHAGANKVETADSAPLTDSAIAHMQEMVDDYMSMFISAVAKGRGVPESVARGPQFGQGRAYTAGRSLERGLIDKVRPLAATLSAYGVDGSDQVETRRGRSAALMRKELDLSALSGERFAR